MNVTSQEVVARLGGDIVGGNVIVRGADGRNACVAKLTDGIFHLTDVGAALWNESDNDERLAVARNASRGAKGVVAEALGIADAVKVNDDLKTNLE